MKYNNLDQTQSFTSLKKTSPADVASLLTAERVTSLKIKEGAFTYYYAALPVTGHVIDLLQQLSDEQQLIEKYNGSIRVESEEGKGSTFSTVFPQNRS